MDVNIYISPISTFYNNHADRYVNITLKNVKNVVGLLVEDFGGTHTHQKRYYPHKKDTQEKLFKEYIFICVFTNLIVYASLHQIYKLNLDYHDHLVHSTCKRDLQKNKKKAKWKKIHGLFYSFRVVVAFSAEF